LHEEYFLPRMRERTQSRSESLFQAHKLITKHELGVIHVEFHVEFDEKRRRSHPLRVRTAVGKFQGALSDIAATQLGAIVVRKPSSAPASTRTDRRMHPGNVLPAGLGQNPARIAAIYGGLATKSATDHHKVCGSALRP